MLMVDSLHPGSSVGIEPFGVKLFYFPAIPCQTSNEDPRRAICGHERAANRQHCAPESAGCIAQPTSSPATTSSSPSQGSGISLVWVYCFLVYAALYTSDQGTHNLLTYARPLIHEVLHHRDWAGWSMTGCFSSKKCWAPHVSGMS